MTFLSWCNAEFEAELHLAVESKPNPRGYPKQVLLRKIRLVLLMLSICQHLGMHRKNW